MVDPRSGWLVVAVTFGVWLALVGVALSPDSVAYADMARSLAQGLGRLRHPDLDDIETLWPPGYSLLLVGPYSLGVAMITAMAMVDGAALGATAACVMARLRVSHVHPAWVAVGVLAVIGSPVVLRVHLWDWSEPTFLAMLSAAMLLLHIATAPH